MRREAGSLPSSSPASGSLGSPVTAGSSPRSPRGVQSVGTALRAEALECGLVVQHPHGDGSPLPPLPEEEQLDGWLQDALARIGEALVSSGEHGTNGAAIFAAIDANGDGSLSPAEFAAAIASLRLDPPLDDEQVQAIFDAVDLNASGTMNYHEFVQGFRITELVSNPLAEFTAGGMGASSPVAQRPAILAAISDDEERHSWKRAVVEKIVLKLFEFRQELGSAFKLFDENGDGVISRDEFRHGLRALTCITGQPLTDMQADEVLKHLDTNGDGSIDYHEFINGFRIM